MKLVSVIIPHYGTSTYLESAIDSALNQTYKNIEVIIVDDGSIPSPAIELKAKYGYLDNFFIYVMAHQGVSAARNFGIEKSHGEIIAFLDSDDVWMPNKLEVQVPLLDEQTTFVHCGYIMISEAGDYLSPGTLPNCAPTFENILLGTYSVTGSASGVIALKKIIMKTNLFNSKLSRGEDWDMWIQLAKLGAPKFTGEVLVAIRAHRKSVQRQKIEIKKLNFRNIVLKSDYFGAATIWNNWGIDELKRNQEFIRNASERLWWFQADLLAHPLLLLFDLPKIMENETQVFWEAMFISRVDYQFKTLLRIVRLMVHKINLLVVSPLRHPRKLFTLFYRGLLHEKKRIGT